MSLKWIQFWEKGIRTKSIRLLILLMVKYCSGYENTPFIDFHHRYGHKGVNLDNLSDVVKLFQEKEGMSKRTAYDYAKAIERIQFLTH